MAVSWQDLLAPPTTCRASKKGRVHQSVVSSTLPGRTHWLRTASTSLSKPQVRLTGSSQLVGWTIPCRRHQRAKARSTVSARTLFLAVALHRTTMTPCSSHRRPQRAASSPETLQVGYCRRLRLPRCRSMVALVRFLAMAERWLWRTTRGRQRWWTQLCSAPRCSHLSSRRRLVHR